MRIIDCAVRLARRVSSSKLIAAAVLAVLLTQIIGIAQGDPPVFPGLIQVPAGFGSEGIAVGSGYTFDVDSATSPNLNRGVKNRCSGAMCYSRVRSARTRDTEIRRIRGPEPMQRAFAVSVPATRSVADAREMVTLSFATQPKACTLATAQSNARFHEAAGRSDGRRWTRRQLRWAADRNTEYP
jgi:hypothetical protein